MKLNDKDAVKIAKWASGQDIRPNGLVYSLYGGTGTFIKAKTWLQSAEGERAMRRKLLSEGRGVYEETRSVIISWPDDTADGYTLIEAIKEMLKND